MKGGQSDCLLGEVWKGRICVVVCEDGVFLMEWVRMHVFGVLQPF